MQSLSGHTTPIECVRFGHTEELVCAGSASGALKIWDLEAARLVRTLTGHKAGIRCIDFHPYGDFLSSGSGDTNLKLWDIRRKGCIFTYKGHRYVLSRKILRGFNLKNLKMSTLCNNCCSHFFQ